MDITIHTGLSPHKTRSFDMKHGKVLLGFLVLFCTAALFLGCDNDGPEGGTELFIEGISVESGQTKYYSLTTGEEVPAEQKNTQKWDIAFKRTRLILTNSGATATTEGSQGGGGVWYAGTTDFGSVTLANKGADTASLSTDTALYVWTGMGQPALSVLNVMTFVGYRYGNGTSDAIPTLQGEPPYNPERDGEYPANGAYTSYLYDADQYYVQESMTVYPSTNKVYIIKHADGSGYSKIQIEYEYVAAVTGDNPVPAKDTFKIKYEKL
jgi:hypothetical protein